MATGTEMRQAEAASGAAARGVAAMVAACVIWGLSPIYYTALAHVPPGELLAHRTLWPAAGFLIWLGLKGRLPEVGALLKGRTLWLVLPATVLIGVNWYLFILAIQLGRTVESSLGYYIFPLMAVALGVVAFGERLTPRQGAAVATAAVAVTVLTLGLGAAPWFALALASTFTLYGALKKRLAAGPVVSVTAELVLLAPLAAVWLGGIHAGLWDEGRPGGWFGHDAFTTLLLAAAGVITSAPLMLFAYAARRVTMATVGLVQYLNPTLQFLCATLILMEPVTRWHAIAFAMIWAALALYSWEALRRERARRRPPVPPAT